MFDTFRSATTGPYRISWLWRAINQPRGSALRATTPPLMQSSSGDPSATLWVIVMEPPMTAGTSTFSACMETYDSPSLVRRCLSIVRVTSG